MYKKHRSASFPTSARSALAILALATAPGGSAFAQSTGAGATPVTAKATSTDGLAAAEGPAPAGGAAAATEPAASLQEVVVTGYRKSLNAALDAKRESLTAVDQIVAEDIAAFPELNLAESIQRVPGVSISRDAGEGRQISVRGLGPQFTRVRLNGMEALTTIGTSDSNGGTNRDRAFDFNVFAAELFNTVTVHKTTSADIDEGSLGATVDLRAPRPFDHPGPAFAVGGKLGYNDLASSYNPRATILLSDTFFDGKFGALLSGAYAHRAIIDDGSSTVRWMNGLNSDGTPNAPASFNSKAIGSNYAASGSTATLAQLNSAFRPRFPRYEEYTTGEKRWGITNSLQWKPVDSTLVSLDSLLAELEGSREEEQLEAPAFSTNGATGIGGITVQAAHIDPIRNNLDYGQFDNVLIRAEHRYDVLHTKFRQHVLSLDQSITDNLKLNALAGWSRSTFFSPTSTTLTWDAKANGYAYDFRDGNSQLPLLSYGSADVTSPSTWTLSQIRLRPNGVENTFTNYNGDLEWSPTKAVTLLGGGAFKRYNFSTFDIRRASESAIPASISSMPTSAYSTTARLTGLDVPAGTPTAWAVPSIGAATPLWNLYDPTVFPLTITANLGNNYQIAEWDSSGFLETQLEWEMLGIRFRGDVGVRYVHTKQSSTGWIRVGSTNQLETVEHAYNDVLPAMNLIANLTDDFLVRVAASKVMARAGLGSLNPGASVSIAGSQKTITAGNPFLDPYRAKAYDLGFEWYFARESLLSLGLFYKDIGSFVETVRQTGPFSSNTSNLPDSVGIAACQAAGLVKDANDPTQVANCLNSWQINVPRNTPGGSLKGVEVDYQQPFWFLPAPFNNFGTVLNYTFVDSTVQYINPNTSSFISNTLTGLSKSAANATLYYDNGTWSARVSAAYRGPYLTTVPGNNNNDVEGTKSTLNIDAAASWNVARYLQLTFEALNITNQFQVQYVDSNGDRINYFHQQGREYFVGFRVKL
jgi:iron complex outermembrane recepter protein